MSVVPDLYVHHRETRHRPPDAVLSAQIKDVDRLAAIDDEIWAAAERAFFHAQHTKLTSTIRSNNCSADEFGAKLRLYGAPVPQDGNVRTSAFQKTSSRIASRPSESVHHHHRRRPLAVLQQGLRRRPRAALLRSGVCNGVQHEQDLL